MAQCELSVVVFEEGLGVFNRCTAGRTYVELTPQMRDMTIQCLDDVD